MFYCTIPRRRRARTSSSPSSDDNVLGVAYYGRQLVISAEPPRSKRSENTQNGIAANE